MLSPTADDPLTAFRHTDECARPNYAYFTGHRGDDMVQCLTCKRTMPLSRLENAATQEAAQERSRWLLLCLCGARIPVTRGEPRVPLCQGCAKTRERERRARRSNGRREETTP